MKFGPEPVDQAHGTILAHSLRLGRTMLRKGLVLGSAELERIKGAGVENVIVARLEPDDVPEDDAARRLGDALLGRGVKAGPAETGRVNLYAAHPGLVACEPAGIDQVNAVSEDLTLATLPRFAPVEAGRMIATVKIIPFAVGQADLARCIVVAPGARIEILPFRPLTARLIQTVHDGVKPSVIAKTSAITQDRLTRLGCVLGGEARCPHEADALTAVLAAQLEEKSDIVLVIGASAIADRRDVIPAAITRLNGRIERLGMPVDPGNLILIGEIAGKPILGLPGCARSPARNGLDWVLERISAGLPVGKDEIAHMGVGGLLLGSDA